MPIQLKPQVVNINYCSKFAITPSSFRLLRRSQVARLYEDIERNVADAGVYQHLKHIATRRLFFPQEISEIRSTIYVPLFL